MRVRRALLVACGLCSLVGALSCNDDSTSSGPTLPGLKTEAVKVYVTDAVGNLAAVNVRFSALTLYSTDGEGYTLTRNGSVTIDLVAAHDNPVYLGQFSVPPGDYSGVEGRVEVVDFQTTDNPDYTCTDPRSPFDIQRMQIRNPVLRVTDNGAELLVELPLVTGECECNGCSGRLIFGPPAVSVR